MSNQINLTENSEKITFTAQDNGDTINVSLNESAVVVAGGGGVTDGDKGDITVSGGGTVWTLDDGVDVGTFTVSTLLTADHIHGNLAGSIYAHVRAAENLAKGDPVYISGSHGSNQELIAEVSRARADDPAKMPAVGVMDAAITQNQTGHMVITGQVTQFNTDPYAVNDTLYVGQTGGLTNAPPEGYLIQPVGRVERDNQNNGAFIVKVNGLASVQNTPHTLAFRDGDGDCNFGRLVSEDEVYIQSDYYGGSIRSDDLTDFRVFQLPDGNDTFALTDQTDGTVSAGYINSGAATNGQVLTADGAGGASFQLPAPNDILEYTSGTGTIQQPDNVKFVAFLLVGGGGGGGSGRRGASTTERYGGGGGGAGGVVMTGMIDANDIVFPLEYSVGSAGAGGSGITADNTNGSNGATGGSTNVQDDDQILNITAIGGLGGSGGSSTAGTAGAGRADAAGMIPVNTATSQGGGAGSNGTGSNAGDTANMLLGSGGGGGGGINTSNVAGNGGRSGFMGSANIYRIGGRAGATSLVAATAGNISAFGFGSGGGGGSGTSGFRNGANGLVGGGGGGGGASLNGETSGAGGNGGSGFLRMYVYY